MYASAVDRVAEILHTFGFLRMMSKSLKPLQGCLRTTFQAMLMKPVRIVL
jgi:hypothetical protein